MSDAMVWGIAGVLFGLLIANPKKGSTATATSANEIEKTADWWTYAGSWA